MNAVADGNKCEVLRSSPGATARGRGSLTVSVIGGGDIVMMAPGAHDDTGDGPFSFLWVLVCFWPVRRNSRPRRLHPTYRMFQCFLTRATPGGTCRTLGSPYASEWISAQVYQFRGGIGNKRAALSADASLPEYSWCIRPVAGNTGVQSERGKSEWGNASLSD